MRRRKFDHTKPLLIIIVILVVACSYFNSGTWDDDEDNWSRAFGPARPSKGIEVIHSQYTRLAHWTTEYIWFFELTLSPATKADILANPAVKRVDLPDKKIIESIQKPQPPWFIPGELSDYDVYRDTAATDFLIFFKRGTDICYWCASQF
jgi:hypothetical protein